jgi:hypothetical protein
MSKPVPSLFQVVDSYIHKLSKILMVKSLYNNSEYILDPYLLYRSHEKDGTDFHNKYPYLGNIMNSFVSEGPLSGEDYKEILRSILGSILMSELELEFKNLNETEFIGAVIAKHNSNHVTLSPVDLQREYKEKALLKIGHNTPSLENPAVTPLDNTAFKYGYGTIKEE